MRYLRQIVNIILITTATGCITQYIPESISDQEFFVVEGMLTDQAGKHTVKLSKSVPLGSDADFNAVNNGTVWISDGTSKFLFSQSSPGVYLSDQNIMGVPGRKYTLNVEIYHYVNNRRVVDYFFQSSPVEMLPVSDIDSLYYERVEIRQEDGFPFSGEGCQVLLNTRDLSGSARYYRWDYKETWQIENPGYAVVIHRVCWATNYSSEIIVKSLADLSQNRLDHMPIRFISNETDRLAERYRIEVNQYSISEDEFKYWSDIKKLNEQSGNLYDMIPSSINGNMHCVNMPDMPVLGYFSVSSKRTKEIYIDEYFKGLYNPYKFCKSDSILKDKGMFPPDMDFLNIDFYLIEDKWDLNPGGFMIISKNRECVDCTVRGSTVKPDYWKFWK
jgi:hypothetical protein